MCMWIITLLCVDLCGGKVTKYLFDPEKIPKQLINPSYIAAIKNTLRENKPVSLPNHKVKFMDLKEMIQSHGFKEEVHQVVTKDGYILGIYRIKGSGPAVILSHGMLDSGDGWVLMGNDSLGVVLAREGYDLWIYNSRGTRYSRGHVTLNRTHGDNRYWRYDWDHLGRYDLPALIDHVTNTSRRRHLHYVGFQQGFTALVVMCGVHRAHCGRVGTAVGIAPAVYLGHVAGPLRTMAAIQAHNRELIEKVADSTTTASYGRFKEPGPLFQVIGADRGHIPPALWPQILRHVPETGSARQVLHYGQLIQSGQFTRYDHGPHNVQRYGTATPPPYSLSHLPRALCLYYSRGDRVVEARDVERLRARLPPLYDHLVLEDYNHLDLMYAPSLRHSLYDRVLKVLFAREHDTRDVGNLTLADSLHYLLTSTTTAPTHHRQHHSTNKPTSTPNGTANLTTTTRKKRFKIPKNLDMHQMISLMKNVKLPPKKNDTEPSNVDKNEDWNKVSFNNLTLKLGRNPNNSALHNKTLELLADVIKDYQKRQNHKNTFKRLSLIPPQPRISMRSTSTTKRTTRKRPKSKVEIDREKYFAAMRTTTDEPERGKKGHLRMNYRMRTPEVYMPIMSGRFLEQRQAAQAVAEAPISYYIHKKRKRRNNTNKPTRIRSKRIGINLRRLGSRHREKWRNFTLRSRYLSNVHTHD